MGGHQIAMGFQDGNDSILCCPSSEMAASSAPVVKPSDEANPFVASSAWDPLVSLSQAQTFGGSSMVSHNEFANSSYPLVLENQGMSSTSHLAQYMSDSNFAIMVANIPSHRSGSFSVVAGSLERASVNGEQSQGKDSTPEEGAPGSGPSEKRRKRGSDCYSTFSPNKNAEWDVMKDSSGKSFDGAKEPDEKKPKVEQHTSASLSGKQLLKQAKENSHSGEATKDNFVHVRARRGQATNSHSLAERIRREKISERMKLLQELVPGCNKIIGKAVMLDEIINYVQSLQQQVEFLSMKLATVNPELNLDIERMILSKDILQSHMGHRPIGGYTSGISSPHPFSTGSGSFLGTEPMTSTQFPPLPQPVFDHEFQSFYGMGYDSNTALHSLGPGGRLRAEL